MKPREFPHFKECGGCDFRLAYPKGQIKKKQEYLVRLFKGYDVAPIKSMKSPYYYRNKVLRTYRQVGKRRVVSGIYEKGSHWVIPIESCLIEDKRAKQIHKTIHRLVKDSDITPFNEDSGEGYLRHVLIRAAGNTGEYSVTFIVKDIKFPNLKQFIDNLVKSHPEVKAIYLNPHSRKTSVVVEGNIVQVYGKGPIKDKLLDIDVLISGDSFYQVNSEQSEKLYELVMELIDPKEDDEILDAYCGIGIMALLAAKMGAVSFGLEQNKTAIRDAQEMKRINEIENVNFICEDATEYMVNSVNANKTINKVILDPPRSGTTVEFINALLKLSPEKIVYVSCNPQKLVEELPLFENDYKVGTIYPIDMFPFTNHVETVCLMSRVKD